jgi:hypothetical protein
MKTKKCRLCGLPQPLTEFNLNTKGCKDGLDSRCKTCERSRRLHDYYARRVILTARAAQWRFAHPVEYKAICARAGKRGREKLLAITRAVRADNPCAVCSEKRINCLEFHHLDDKEKTRAIAACKSLAQLRGELSKCIVLCSNCHALYHAGDVIIPADAAPICAAKYLPPEK